MSEGKLAQVTPLFAGGEVLRRSEDRLMLTAEDLAGMSVRLDGWVSLDGDEGIRQAASITLVPGQRWSTIDERVVAELGVAPVEGVVEVDAVVFQLDGEPIRLRRLRARVISPLLGAGLRLGYSVARLRLSFGVLSGG